MRILAATGIDWVLIALVSAQAMIAATGGGVARPWASAT